MLTVLQALYFNIFLFHSLTIWFIVTCTLLQEQKVVSRQQILEKERSKRYEEIKARDAAVEDRRRQQETERVAKISDMEERKRLRVKKVEQHISDRLQQVRDKAGDRALKLTAIEKAQHANLKSLKEKLQKKVEVSTRLHEERMELKRLRAQYLNSPRPGSADSANTLHENLFSVRYRSHTGDDSPGKDKEVKERIEEQVEINHIASRYEKLGRKLRLKLLKRDPAFDLVPRENRLECGDVSLALEVLESLRSTVGWKYWSSRTTAMDSCLERIAKHLGSVPRAKEKNMVRILLDIWMLH